MAGTAFIPMEDEVVVSDGTTALILLIFFAVLVAGIFLIIHFIRSGRAKKLVMKTSPAYLGLQELNKKYKEIFKWFNQNYKYSSNAKSKQSYDNYFHSKKYNEHLQRIFKEIQIEELDYAVQWNKDKYKNYMQEYNTVVVYTTKEKFQELTLPRKISYRRFSRAEHHLNLNAMEVPMSFEIIIQVLYRSPKGRNHYSNGKILKYEDAVNIYYKFLESERAQTESQKQRSLMTPKLRYEVMKRDGFKCVICGRSTEIDGVTLEVDHILPVAKGGKTEIDNLRTLCRDCNRGKSDTYDADGVN